MNVITRIESKGKNAKIYFDSSEVLQISKDNLANLNLQVNDSLSDEVLERLKYFDELNRAKNSANRFLAIRDHSILELKRKLFQKKYNSKVIGQVIQELLELGVLNDERFAESFVEEKIHRKNFGKDKIRAELMNKGIKTEIINNILSKYFNSPEIELKLIAKTAEKFIKKGIDLSKFEDRVKLCNHLLYKGYSRSLVTQYIQNIQKQDKF
ncbi:MAG: recombination regulator RecX [Ignavibacteria bacterium]|nr:recombination regulator RecX [Ignavibacteria bacterium]